VILMIPLICCMPYLRSKLQSEAGVDSELEKRGVHFGKGGSISINCAKNSTFPHKIALPIYHK
jgi:hypothetical protein